MTFVDFKKNCMVFLDEKQPDGIYPLSYLHRSDCYTCFEVYDYLITDGDVESLVSDYRLVNDNVSYVGETESVEVFKAVSISNASYTIRQRIQDGVIKFSSVQTLLKQDDLLDKLFDMSSTIYEDECEELSSMNLVEKVKIR